MSEWWTYGASDFLMFSPRTWWRLVAQYHAALWPVQWLGLAGSALAVALALRARERARARQALALVLALSWAWVAWAFHWQRHATINLAAPWLAGLFALQSLLYLAAAALPGVMVHAAPARPWRTTLGWLLAALGLAGPALQGWQAGRPWEQTEIFGVMPDPTALGSLGLWLAATGGRPAWLLPGPILAVAIGLATRWVLR